MTMTIIIIQISFHITPSLGPLNSIKANSSSAAMLQTKELLKGSGIPSGIET